ncbi:MAG: hypothetical protein LUE89_12165 [Clostridiales bacterium]|nr:hypothetical protein [Clostridiales bacterium]
MPPVQGKPDGDTNESKWFCGMHPIQTNPNASAGRSRCICIHMHREPGGRPQRCRVPLAKAYFTLQIGDFTGKTGDLQHKKHRFVFGGPVEFLPAAGENPTRSKPTGFFGNPKKPIKRKK